MRSAALFDQPRDRSEGGRARGDGERRPRTRNPDWWVIAALPFHADLTTTCINRLCRTVGLGMTPGAAFVQVPAR